MPARGTVVMFKQNSANPVNIFTDDLVDVNIFSSLSNHCVSGLSERMRIRDHASLIKS